MDISAGGCFIESHAAIALKAGVKIVLTVPGCESPLSGEIVEVNESLSSAPEAINDDPYDTGWMVRVRLSDPSEVDSLMDAAAYQESLGQP